MSHMTNQSNQRFDPKRVSAYGVFIFLIVSLFFIYEFFLRTSLDALEGMPHDLFVKMLDITPMQLSLVGAAYAITYSVMQIPVGVIVDRYGVRKVGTLALIGCVIGVVVFSLAQGFYSAFIGRLMIGFGSAFAFVLLLKVAMDWFPQRVLGLALGMTQILGMLGPLLSDVPLSASLKAVDYQWRLIFYVIAAVGVILSIVFFIFVKDRYAPDRQSTWKQVGCKIVSLFKYKQLLAIAMFAFFIYPAAELFGSLYGSSYLETRGITSVNASGVIMFIWLGMGIGSPIIGLASDYIKRRKPLLYFSAILGIAASILIIYGPTFSTGIYDLLFFCFGFATGAQAFSFALVVENIPAKLEATAVGFNNMCVLAGTAIIQMCGGMILSLLGGKNGNQLIHYQIMLGLSVLFFMVAFIAAVCFVKETYCQRRFDKVMYAD